MNYLFDTLSTRLTAGWKRRDLPRAGRSYRCRCGRPVFFANSECLACHAPLGYEPELAEVSALVPGPEAGTWRLDPTTARGDGEAVYRRCANFEGPAGCNWLVPVGDPIELCRACRLNRTIPDLADPVNAQHWRKLERAKRRLISQLIALGLPVRSKVSEDPERGLAFDFLRSPPEGPRVLTGHDNGLITLNVEEADDATRERIRQEMREPYRTLLGHFRHEIGHYYWDLLVLPTPWIDDYRALFGDERADYGAALQQHYEQGPPPDWAQRFVSSYASMHPWEDWAETWAHYLHMADTADTAMSFGIDASNVELTSDLFTAADLWQPEHPDAAKFLDFINGWVLLTSMLNELSRSMGQPDYYPFVLPRAAVGKLQFIHGVITAQRSGTAPTMVMAGDVAAPAAEAAEPAPVQSQTQSQAQLQAQSQGDVAQS